MEKLYKTIDEKEVKQRKEKLHLMKEEGKKLGKLFGMEIALEDNISTRGMKTEVGSKMLKDYIPPFDADLVKRIQDEDAIIKGKIETREFGVGKDIDSKLGGVVKIGQAHASIGIDAKGEVRNIAAKANLYGLKPSYGSVSRYGLIGSAPSLEQVGIIAEDVDTIEKIYHIICGKDKKDSSSLQIEKRDVKNVKDLKIAVLKEHINSQDENIRKKIEESIEKIKELGVKIEYVSIPSVKYSPSIYNILQSAEFSSDMGKFDGVVYGYKTDQYSDNEDFFKKNRSLGFSEEVKKKIMFGNFVLSEENYKDYYEKSQKIRTLIAKEVEKVFESYDIILSPIWEDINTTVLANLVGSPALSLPSEEKRFNLQIMGQKFSEETLFKLAKAYIGKEEK